MFLTDLEVRHLNGLKELRAPLVFTSPSLGRVVVPPGFRTNFGSVPRLPFVYLIAGGVGDKAATVHDWLVGESTGTPVPGVSRRQAARVFYEALRAQQVPAPVAWSMWLGVRLNDLRKVVLP